MGPAGKDGRRRCLGSASRMDSCGRRESVVGERRKSAVQLCEERERRGSKVAAERKERARARRVKKECARRAAGKLEG
jgi:hypothetical protein